MQKIQQITRNFMFICWAVFLTTLTYVLGAPILKTLRRRLGRLIYWPVFLAICAGMVIGKAQIFAVTLLSLVVLMGVFEEFEEMGLTFRLAAFFTILVNALLSAGAFALWVFYSGPKWSLVVRSNLEALLKPALEVNPNFKVDVGELMMQLPSVALIAWMIAIYLAVLFERRNAELDTRHEVALMRPQLTQLRLPDVVVWVFIAALLGTFGNFEKHWVQVLSINVMNVCLLLFFFQGIAVVARFFETLKMSLFWQWAFMVLIVVQLFLLVSVLGLMDHWIDFRGRLQRRTQQFKRET